MWLPEHEPIQKHDSRAKNSNWGRTLQTYDSKYTYRKKWAQ